MTKFTSYLKRTLSLLFLMVAMVTTAWGGEEVTYTIDSKTSVTTSGTAPTGSKATFSTTYDNNNFNQLTGGKSMTLTISGFSGKKITGLTLSMKSNKSSGAGYLDAKVGTKSFASIGSESSGIAFNNAAWNGKWSTSFTDVTPTVTPTKVENGEDIVITIGATANSLYCKSFTIIYENAATEAFTVNFINDASKGSCQATSITETKANAGITLPDCTPNDGYIYLGWATTEDATSADAGTAGETYHPSANTTLYAVYAEIYTISWSVNGNISSTQEINGTSITFSAPTENIPNGYEFMGWSATEVPTQQEAPTYVTDATAEGNTTYYAVFAKKTQNGTAEETLSQTLKYDTWTFGGSTTNKNSYRLFHNGGYVESADFDLSKLTKVIVYGGTFGGDGFNSLTIGDGTNTWKNVTVTGNSQTGKNTYTEGTSLSGNGKLIITSNSGTASSSGTGVRMSKVEIYTMEPTYAYSDFCTSVGTETVAYTPATLTLKANSGDNYYATFSNEAATFFPETDADMTFMTEAQTAFADGDELLLTTLATANANIDGNETSGYFVPANTGVLIKASFDKEDTTIPYYTVTGKTVDALADNMLHPSSETMTGDYYFYKLAYDNISTKTGLGFYWGAENGGEFTSKSGLAYLAVPKTASAKTGFAFDNSTSGIESVGTETSKNDVMYNLAGMRVNNNYKGIVIVNGKKMIRK